MMQNFKKLLTYFVKSTREMILLVLVFLVVLVLFFKILPQGKSPDGKFPLQVLELPASHNGIQYDTWPNPNLTYQGVETMELFKVLRHPAALPEMALIHFFYPGCADSVSVNTVWNMWQKNGMRRILVSLADTVNYPVWHFVDQIEKADLIRFFKTAPNDTTQRDFTLLYLNGYPTRLYFIAGPMDINSVNLYLTREFRGEF